MAEKSTIQRRISVVLADGNPLVLSAMSEIFENDDRFSIVATTRTAEGFLGTVMRVPTNLGVIDWNLPALGGQRLLEVLRDHTAAPRIVVYGEASGSEAPRQAMASGAAGFCARSESPERLVETVLSVAEGNMVFPFLDVRELQEDPIFRLTRRERALLEALAKGLTNKALANDFDISVNTVKFHLGNLYEKLSVASRAEAIAYFYSSRVATEAARLTGLE